MFQYITKSGKTNREEWHYITVKTLPVLLRRIRSKHQGDFYCLNFLQQKTHTNLIKTFDFCRVAMLSEDTKTLELNQYQKSDKSSFVIYAAFKFLIEKIDRYKNNTENLSTTKEGYPISPGFLYVCNIII